MAKQGTSRRNRLETLLRNNLTIGPEQLAESGDFGGRNAVYGACGRGEIECFRAGKLIRIPTAPLRRRLGIEEA